MYFRPVLLLTCNEPPDPQAGVIVGQGGVTEDVEAGDGDQEQGAQVLSHHGEEERRGPGQLTHLS